MKCRYLHIAMMAWMLCALAACRSAEADAAGEIIAQVGQHQLTRADLDAAVGRRASEADSARLAEAYVRSWLKENLIFDKAHDNVRSLDEINREAEAYRRRLIIFEYEQRLMNERLATEISEPEMEAFYNAHRSEFVLKQPLVRGLFLKVPQDAPQIADLKKWVSRRIDDATLEKIEKYSLRNALVYEYFFDRWEPFGELMRNIPYETGDANRFLATHKAVETTSDGFWYYLYVSEYVAAGEPEPFDFARESVREAMLNLRRKEFVDRVEEELLQEAIKKNKIKFYQPATGADDATDAE